MQNVRVVVQRRHHGKPFHPGQPLWYMSPRFHSLLYYYVYFEGRVGDKSSGGDADGPKENSSEDGNEEILFQ
jgi:hypothetical protein